MQHHIFKTDFSVAVFDIYDKLNRTDNVTGSHLAHKFMEGGFQSNMALLAVIWHEWQPDYSCHLY